MPTNRVMPSRSLLLPLALAGGLLTLTSCGGADDPADPVAAAATREVAGAATGAGADSAGATDGTVSAADLVSRPLPAGSWARTCWSPFYWFDGSWIFFHAECRKKNGKTSNAVILAGSCHPWKLANIDGQFKCEK